MGWTAAAVLIAVMLVIAAAAGAGGYWASVVTQRRNSRARGPFVVGVLCGVVVGAALTARRRGLNAVGASALKTVVLPLRSGIEQFVGPAAAAISSVPRNILALLRVW